MPSGAQGALCSGTNNNNLITEKQSVKRSHYFPDTTLNPIRTPAPTHATAPAIGAPAGAPRYGPQPTVPQPQGWTLAQFLAGARRLTATTGLANETETADTNHAPRGPRGPETDQEAQTADSRDTPPTPPADPRRRSSAEDAGAGVKRGAQDDTRWKPSRSQHAERQAKAAAEAVAVPAPDLGTHVPPA